MVDQIIIKRKVTTSNFGGAPRYSESIDEFIDRVTSEINIINDVIDVKYPNDGVAIVIRQFDDSNTEDEEKLKKTEGSWGYKLTFEGKDFNHPLYKLFEEYMLKSKEENK